jgi:TRAP-type mannitol/chloroaromatic compound transport system permease small subunit
MTFLSAAYALHNSALIRVNILLEALPGGSLSRRFVELLCVLLTMAACGLIAIFFGNSAWRHFARGTVSETVAEVPMWIPEGFVLVGLVILELELLSYALRIMAGDHLLDGGGEGARRTSTE